jgi:hypothetical protein
VDPETRDELDRTMAAIAAQTGAVLHTYPRPGRAVRRVVLRDIRDDRGTQFEAAQMEDDGTLRVVGHDTGPGGALSCSAPHDPRHRCPAPRRPGCRRRSPRRGVRPGPR